MNSSNIDVINPSTGETLAVLEPHTWKQAAEKMELAWCLFKDTARHLALHERMTILEKLVALMERDADIFSMTIAEDGGKPLADARVETSRAIAGIRMAIQAASEHRGRVIPLGRHAASAGRLGVTQKYPRGVVLAFSAFNHPLNLVIHQAIAAFAAGCPCVVKPAVDTPLACLKLMEVMYEAGVPDDYVSCVITADLDVAAQMVRSDKIAFFSFIGSARVGWMLRSQLQPGVRCALEHGGVAPCLVTDTADLKMAMLSITKGAFYHAGQVCVSTQRVYVDRAIEDEFLGMLTDSVTRLAVGNAAHLTTDVGPLIRPAEAERVADWIQDAVSLGGTILAGGARMAGNFHQPTVIYDPSVEAKVSYQEVFGPVVCVYPYDDFDKVLMEANAHPYAFQAAIYTSDIDAMYAAYDALDASAVMVNDHTAFRDDAMPFAGLGVSGLGVGGMPHTIDEMQFEKMMVIKHM